MFTSTRSQPHAVQTTLTETSVASENKTTEGATQPDASLEDLSSDILAFCRLIARILMRILQEHNDQVVKNLFKTSPDMIPPGGTPDEPAV